MVPKLPPWVLGQFSHAGFQFLSLWHIPCWVLGATDSSSWNSFFFKELFPIVYMLFPILYIKRIILYKQQGPTLLHRELYSISHNPQWKRIWTRIHTYIHIYIHMYNRITLLYTVNQLYFNNKNKSMIHTFKKAIFKSILCEVTLLLCLFSLVPSLYFLAYTFSIYYCRY